MQSKYVEDLFNNRMVRIPRKVKKQAKKNGVIISAKMGRAWLAFYPFSD